MLKLHDFCNRAASGAQRDRPQLAAALDYVRKGDAIAKIRTQIATADLTRQTQGKPIDPVWFNRARTAQRHLYRERAELLADGSGWHRRNKVKDALIDILRARHDPEIWTELLAEARARSEAEDL